MKKATPQIRTADLSYKGKPYNIEYFFRSGNKETIMLIHGLGGAKENFWEACKTDALAEHTLICMDNPGTGNSTYYEDSPLNMDDLVQITTMFIGQLNLPKFILCGTSMGGLTTMLYLKRGGLSKVKAYINIEGNFMLEDCMFSSKVVTYGFEAFKDKIFPKTIIDMKAKGNPGYHIIANNLELNTNVKSYYNYSFQTVEYSSTGDLLKQYLSMDIPRVFMYGEKNKGLSYLPKMRDSGMDVREIKGSDHFVFYDNPGEMYREMGRFVSSL